MSLSRIDFEKAKSMRRNILFQTALKKSMGYLDGKI
jgi:hypothetical protein